METTLKVRVEVQDRIITVVCGTVQLYLAKVADRYNSNGTKRPRTLAVYMGTPMNGMHMTVEKAVNLWGRMGLPMEMLDDELKKKGWGE